jgi:GTP cyclohydrolase-4
MSLPHKAFLAMGSELGSRQANILQALQYLRARARLKKVSSFYEVTEPGQNGGPKPVKAVAVFETDLAASDFAGFVTSIERRMGRRDHLYTEPCPIKLELLFFDDLKEAGPNYEVPYPDFHKQEALLAALAEVAADENLPEMPAGWQEKKPGDGVKKLIRGLKLASGRDVQQSEPAVRIGLSRAGVTCLPRVIRLNGRSDIELFQAEIDIFVDLDPSQSGVHMSRFSDVLETLVEEISLEPSPSIESLAKRLAGQVLKSQAAVCAQVHIRAKSALAKDAPVTGKRSEDLYTLIGIAQATAERTKSIVGVETEGMTVCPCAQDMVRAYAEGLLLDDGFDQDQASRILELVPLASHNQRGRGGLYIGSDRMVRAENLVHIVEASMSSETYELLKRPDEFFVVNKAHRNPRFVEDVVREMLRNVVECYPDLPGDCFVLARQENFEGIHQHNAFAERYGTLGSMRAEMKGKAAEPRLTMEEWLKA